MPTDEELIALVERMANVTFSMEDITVHRTYLTRVFNSESNKIPNHINKECLVHLNLDFNTNMKPTKRDYERRYTWNGEQTDG